MNQKERITDALNNAEYQEREELIKQLQSRLTTANDENKRLQKILDIVTKDNKGGWLKRVAQIEENKRLWEEISRWNYLLPLIKPVLIDAQVLIVGIIKDNGGVDKSSYSDVVFKRQVKNVLNELQALKGD